MGCLMARAWGEGEANGVGVKVTTLRASGGLGTWCVIPQVTVDGRNVFVNLGTPSLGWFVEQPRV